MFAESGLAESPAHGWVGIVRFLRGYERLATELPSDGWLLRFEDGTDDRLVTLESVSRGTTASGNRATALISAAEDLPPAATEFGGD